MHPQVADFAKIFEGFQKAYGAYKLTEELRSDGKVLGKGYSLNGDVTMELWHMHLMGKQGLGIVPINADSMCRFGAIDVDEYPVDLLALNKNIVDNQLPLVVCRTKSGGAHLYLFTTEFVEARLIHQKLKEMAAFLGYSNCEIYPKQVQLLAERGDAGNWINMPYFDAGKTMRYGVGENHKSLPILDFVKYVYSKMVEPKVLATMKLTKQERLPGGPPCLQLLAERGFPQGTRNNGLFNLGIYSMKSNPDGWQNDLENYNRRFMTPPLSSEEVNATIKSLTHKEYNYTCKSQPIASHCNSTICRTCKFGVGGADLGMPKMGTLSKLCTEPPIWFLDVETDDGGKRLELSTEELQQPILFQNKCMSVLNTMPIVHKRDVWTQMIGKLMEDVTLITVPPELTPYGQMMQHLEDFLTSRVQAKVVDEILLGKPWNNGQGEIHFRLRDLMQYFERVRFTTFKMNYVAMHLREIEGFKKTFHNIKGKGANVFVVPEATFTKQTEEFEAAKFDEEAM